MIEAVSDEDRDDAEEEEEKSDPRGRTLPVDLFPAWWSAEVLRVLKRDDHDQKWLAEELTVSASRISRCIGGKVPTLALVEAISNKLRVPMPVIFPSSLSEADAIDSARRRFRLDAQVVKIKAGVTKRSK